MKLNKDNLIKEVIALNPKTAKEVLVITSHMAAEQHWKRHGISRIELYFNICGLLNIDDTDLR